ncbi:contact-dependent growth inhibition system immunity protein [Streptomyces sp. NPDC006285]|uniref:contact-dependent growth inhibition system immunity protein n=1 Tax=Streptomyces sp. NPDC006285 TaxID=3364742 RepID=UPI0036C10CB8
MNRRDRSLEELERDRWPAPPGGETRLMATVRELRRKPIGGLTVEDMRLLLGQDVGLAHPLPLAVEVLRINPLAEGDMYEGDLLAAVLTRRAEVWNEFPELEREVRLIVGELADVPPALNCKVKGSWLSSSPTAAPEPPTDRQAVCERFRTSSTSSTSGRDASQHCPCEAAGHATAQGPPNRRPGVDQS